jgi:hypothetical protein
VLQVERDHQAALWPTLGPPGAVLAGGGVAGIWRSRLAGRSLTLTASTWRTLGHVERAVLEEEAQIVGTVRGAARTNLVIE